MNAESIVVAALRLAMSAPATRPHPVDVAAPMRRLRELAASAERITPDEAAVQEALAALREVLRSRLANEAELEAHAGEILRHGVAAIPALPLVTVKPWHTTVAEILAGADPERPALAAPGRLTLSYGEVLARVHRFAAHLRERGVRRGDRVALVLREGPELAIALLATMSAATAAPLNPSYREQELELCARDFGVRAVILETGASGPMRSVAEALGLIIVEVSVDGELISGTAAAPLDLARPDDTALVLHTSGTTQRPKIVPLRHRDLATTARNIAARLELTPSDRCLNVMPMFHVHGIANAMLSSLAAGASVACAPGFEAPAFFRQIEELEPTWYTAVPTIHAAVVKHASSHRRIIERSRLRFVRSSSARLPGALFAELERSLGVPVIESYGMSEVDQIASNALPPFARKPGSVGPPGGPEVAILDEGGAELERGLIGEVAVRGPNVMAGYESAPEANARAFSDGWFRTGDQGYFDTDGYLFLTGRLKEIINRAGEKISPLEIEESLAQHPSVEQALVGAVPHPELGEDVVAAVVLRAERSASEAELRRFVAERLAEFKVPRRIAVVESLPRGPTGKLLRRALPDLIVGATVLLDKPDTPDSLELMLLEIWEQVLELQPIRVDDDFLSLGGTSLLARKLFARIEQAFDRALPPSAALEAATVAELAAQLRSAGWR